MDQPERHLIYALTSAALLGIGLHGFVVQASYIRKILALNVMGGGIFLLLVSVAYRNRDGMPDPVPQALVLTGIVVAVSSSAFTVTLARRIHRESETDPHDVTDDHRGDG